MEKTFIVLTVRQNMNEWSDIYIFKVLLKFFNYSFKR